MAHNGRGVAETADLHAESNCNELTTEQVRQAVRDYGQAIVRVNKALASLTSQLTLMREEDLSLLKRLIHIGDSIRKLTRHQRYAQSTRCPNKRTQELMTSAADLSVSLRHVRGRSGSLLGGEYLCNTVPLVRRQSAPQVCTLLVPSDVSWSSSRRGSNSSSDWNLEDTLDFGSSDDGLDTYDSEEDLLDDFSTFTVITKGKVTTYSMLETPHIGVTDRILNAMTSIKSTTEGATTKAIVTTRAMMPTKGLTTTPTPTETTSIPNTIIVTKDDASVSASQYSDTNNTIDSSFSGQTLKYLTNATSLHDSKQFRTHPADVQYKRMSSSDGKSFSILETVAEHQPACSDLLQSADLPAIPPALSEQWKCSSLAHNLFPNDANTLRPISPSDVARASSPRDEAASRLKSPFDRFDKSSPESNTVNPISPSHDAIRPISTPHDAVSASPLVETPLSRIDVNDLRPKRAVDIDVQTLPDIDAGARALSNSASPRVMLLPHSPTLEDVNPTLLKNAKLSDSDTSHSKSKSMLLSLIASDSSCETTIAASSSLKMATTLHFLSSTCTKHFSDQKSCQHESIQDNNYTKLESNSTTQLDSNRYKQLHSISKLDSYNENGVDASFDSSLAEGTPTFSNANPALTKIVPSSAVTDSAGASDSFRKVPSYSTVDAFYGQKMPSSSASSRKVPSSNADIFFAEKMPLSVAGTSVIEKFPSSSSTIPLLAQKIPSSTEKLPMPPSFTTDAPKMLPSLNFAAQISPSTSSSSSSLANELPAEYCTLPKKRSKFPRAKLAVDVHRPKSHSVVAETFLTGAGRCDVMDSSNSSYSLILRENVKLWKSRLEHAHSVRDRICVLEEELQDSS